MNVSELVAQVLDVSLDIDLAMVRACKRLVSTYQMKNQNMEHNGLDALFDSK